jgi:hypothetical protein
MVQDKARREGCAVVGKDQKGEAAHTSCVPEDDEEGGVSPWLKRYGPRKRGEKVGCGWAAR